MNAHKNVNPQTQAQDLLSFIDQSPSPWHVVNSVESLIKPFNFVKLDETSDWRIETGGRYYVVRDDSSIIVIVAGSKPLIDTGFKLIGAHTDSPGLRVKPNAINNKDGLQRVNVEVYGSPILATFTDRDLSLAGRLCYRNKQNQIASRLIRFDEPLIRLANLAIHMNRSVNEDGLKLHKQNELPLFMSAVAEQLPEHYFNDLLAQQSGLARDCILSWDLAVYDTQKGVIWGAQQEFISNSQLDNLASCHAALQALLAEDSLNSGNTLVCALFDHEEIGSTSKHGADGSFLPDVLQRLTLAQQYDRHEYARILAKSFLISADMAHAYHPNFPAAYDAEHRVAINGGPVIKTNANQRYSSEGMSEALCINWCQQAEVPYQHYSHRCDLPCGSTIGPIASAKLGVRSVDIGCPMWAMHSIRESAGVADHSFMIKVLQQFFQS